MTRSTIVFLVNAGPGSAMDVRARSFAERLSGDFQIEIAYRAANKMKATFRFLLLLLRVRPAVCYVFDIAFSGVLAAGCYRLMAGCPMVVDTGDAIYELSRVGARGWGAVGLTWLLEQFAFLVARRIVVRSHPHQELLQRSGIKAEVIPDGVDAKQFQPHEELALRREYGLEQYTVIGLLGSLTWNPRSRLCYGLELIEVIDRLRHLPVKGLIIGDGSGLSILKAECAARGLVDRIVFVGRMPYDELPRYVNLLDICLSTQTNDVVGNVRTTGKLPLYLSCGRFVLSSDVGEASRVLPSEMLVRYESSKDLEYPSRLAARIQSLLQNPSIIRRPEQSVEIAKTHFEYDLLAARMKRVLSDCCRVEKSLHHEPVLATHPKRGAERASSNLQPPR